MLKKRFFVKYLSSFVQNTANLGDCVPWTLTPLFVVTEPICPLSVIVCTPSQLCIVTVTRIPLLSVFFFFYLILVNYACLSYSGSFSSFLAN